MATIEQQKLELEFESFKTILSPETKRSGKIVAEGDSWFAYPIFKDIIDQLRGMGYGVVRFSRAGDTLENMVYGTETNDSGPREANKGPQDLNKVLGAIDLYKPRFVLFSGGGNDIVGKEMIQFINHKLSGAQVFDRMKFEAHVEGPMKTAIREFISKVWQKDTDIDIIMDGYDYAKPNGKGYRVVANWTGPWLRPNFIQKGWDGTNDRSEHMDPTVREMVDIFNNMLARLANEYPKFHHIDLRGWFPDEVEWHNEIHLKAAGFKKVAKAYHDRMLGILNARGEEAEVV